MIFDFTGKTEEFLPPEVADQTITIYGGNYDFYEHEGELRKTQLIAAAKRQ